jgi:hypothetical protein
MSCAVVCATPRCERPRLRRTISCSADPRSTEPFLKEFVKWKVFPVGLLRNGSSLLGRMIWCSLLFPLDSVFHCLDSCWLSSLRDVAIVLFWRDCSQHIPSRVTAHVNRERLCQFVADADLSTANSSPVSPLQSKGRADALMFGSAHSIHGSVRVGPH